MIHLLEDREGEGGEREKGAERREKGEGRGEGREEEKRRAWKFQCVHNIHEFDTGEERKRIKGGSRGRTEDCIERLSKLCCRGERIRRGRYDWKRRRGGVREVWLDAYLLRDAMK